MINQSDKLVADSFISFCDDMTIANEGFKDITKTAWIHIKNIF